MNDSTNVAILQLQIFGAGFSLTSILAFLAEYSPVFVAVSAILSIILSVLALSGKFHRHIRKKNEPQ